MWPSVVECNVVIGQGPRRDAAMWISDFESDVKQVTWPQRYLMDACVTRCITTWSRVTRPTYADHLMSLNDVWWLAFSLATLQNTWAMVFSALLLEITPTFMTNQSDNFRSSLWRHVLGACTKSITARNSEFPTNLRYNRMLVVFIFLDVRDDNHSGVNCQA